MRLLFLGDLVGRTAREAVARHVPRLRQQLNLDAVICNGENAAGGFGITEKIMNELLDAGVDAVTLGNHAFDQREALVFIERQPRLVRPLNYPAGTPGRGVAHFETQGGQRVAVINLMGRVFMDQLDDPFTAIDAALEACCLKTHADAVVIDFHAEASSEKQIFAHYCDGRASLVVGTHTHVPTADHHVLPQGTAYITDVGMCGDYNSIIGMDRHEPMNRMLRKISSARFEASTGPATLCGVVVELADETGLARSIQPLRFGGVLETVVPGCMQL